MSKHYGQILEYTIRKSGYNLSELAKILNVNRRTLYNWFKTPRLRADIIFRIGVVIRHNFSTDFPELFTASQFNAAPKVQVEEDILNDEEWRDKYIDLLEKYNEALLKALKQSKVNKLFIN